MLLEICAGSLNSALAAQAGGAHRIELCDNLSAGGTTPSPGVIRKAIELLSIPVFVLIRPRIGDFLYKDQEFEAMKDDILFCKEHGAKGVVLGILMADGSVDIERTAQLVQIARPMQVTFHRAFDMSRNPFQAMGDIISMGIERLLTSGQQTSAIQGAGLIRELVRKAAGRTIIMPGGGINEENVSDLAHMTGAAEFHASLRYAVKSRMEYRNPSSTLGLSGADEYSWQEANPERIRNILKILENRN